MAKTEIKNAITGESEIRDFTSAEITEMANSDAVDNAVMVKIEEAKQTKENLKASAKAKLIAGEPLTEAEADTIVI